MTVSGHQLIADVAAERAPRLYRECIYCGDRCYGLACRSHRDLLQLDPNTYAMRLRATAPAAKEGAAA